MNAVYLAVSIDCECDKGPGWRVRKPLSFVGVTEGMSKRLGPLFKSRRAKARMRDRTRASTSSRSSAVPVVIAAEL